MRTRSIKLNVFLNEDEQKLLKEKSNKIKLIQFDFIRKLIKDYTYEIKPKIDIETMDTIIKSSIKDLIKINDYMHRL